jgi:hypothetical protein
LPKIMPTRGHRGGLLFGASLALAGLAAGCDPPVPSPVSYEADVRPIFMSHCVRCHGAGGTLNEALLPTGPDAAPSATDPASGKPLHCYLDQYGDTGDCTPGDGGISASCHQGALRWATIGANSIGIRVHGSLPSPMPPPPAPRLDAWELKVIDAWVLNPVCSSAARPDPAICPPDSGVGP